MQELNSDDIKLLLEYKENVKIYKNRKELKLSLRKYVKLVKSELNIN